MQNAIQKFRQSSIVEKPGILSENLKTLKFENFDEFNIFCWNFAHVFYLPLSKKGCVGFFYFIWILSYLKKLKKTWFLHTRFLHFY